MQCRICLEEDSPETLVQPCRCSGSIAYIHTACLETYCLYVPDRICRVCRTPLLVPTHPIESGCVAVLFVGLCGSLVVMNETMAVRCSCALAITCLALLYRRLPRPPSSGRLAAVLFLWGCLSWIETMAAMMTFLGILGLILTVYTLARRLSPLVVLVLLMHLLVVAYLAVLTMVMFISLNPVAFGVFLTILYLLWDLWMHTPRLFGE